MTVVLFTADGVLFIEVAASMGLRTLPEIMRDARDTKEGVWSDFASTLCVQSLRLLFDLDAGPN